MKKRKIVVFFYLAILISRIPILNTTSVTFPKIDPSGDVIFIQYGETTIAHNPSVDIISIDRNDSHIIYSFLGSPSIDYYHGYNVTIIWDSLGFNITECLAGYHVGNGFVNGTRTILRTVNGTLISITTQSNTAFVFLNSIYFPEDTSNLTLTKKYNESDIIVTSEATEFCLITTVYPAIPDDCCSYCDTNPDDCDIPEDPPTCPVDINSFRFYFRMTIFAFAIIIVFRKWKKKKLL